LDYLKSEKTLKLPDELPGFKKPEVDLFGQVDSEEEWSDWSDEETDPTGSEEIIGPETTKHIQNVIQRMRRKFVPKLNWSCPSDATWQMMENTVRCITLNDIFLLLKSSDKINHDLSCPFEHCVDCPEDSTDSVEYSIGLEQFAQLKPISEFRCFIRKSKLQGK